ncbi:hypothetical protein [Olivibacter jilunii]|uniref:hypothetical protein n=1 Tax=Olivibacter jilunii TaxID=985016 RepID=UPI003F13FB9C
MAKHQWHVLEPFHFFNPLGYCTRSGGANALLLVASVSFKAAFPTHRAIFRVKDVYKVWLKVKALGSAKIAWSRDLLGSGLHVDALPL